MGSGAYQVVTPQRYTAHLDDMQEMQQCWMYDNNNMWGHLVSVSFEIMCNNCALFYHGI